MHNKPNDLWIIIDNYVYDITSWQHKHPGGSLVLKPCGGRDASDVFLAYHKDEVRKILFSFLVGKLKNNNLS